jgi:hypothetical protein
VIDRVRSFWLNSYRTDPRAFFFELTSFIFTVAASLQLAIHADAPDLKIVYPAFFIGSVTQCYAASRRGAAWVMLLTFYFACVNIFGYGRAVGWW